MRKTFIISIKVYETKYIIICISYSLKKKLLTLFIFMDILLIFQ
jgi:hypothetical protein